jgi:hypothetical protein
MKNAELKFKWSTTRKQMVWFLMTFKSDIQLLNNMFMGVTREEADQGLAELNQRRSDLGLYLIEV